MRELKEINFNNGVRSEKIQYNFEVLLEQMANDRLSTYGKGISNGIEFTINDFNITISAGEIITNNGYLIGIDETTLNIELPKLTTITEKNLIVGNNGRIVLKEIPYDLSRLHVARTDKGNNGIKIVTSSGAEIKPRIISDNILFIDDNYSNTTIVNVTYSYTNKRYDTLYIDKNKELKVIQGTTSASPSIILPDEEDIYYTLCYLEINPYYLSVLNEKIANLSIKDDLRTFKNIYTDENNILYICGVPFDDLQIIHIERPNNPKEYTLWYDKENNILKIWRTIDGIGQWLNVNNPSYANACEVRQWDEYHNPKDEQYFLFKPNEINYRFNPGKNELAVSINQCVLHYDQYDEITFKEAIENDKIKNRLLDLGYDENIINQINSQYENVGIGFRLKYALDKPCFVEAIITHRTTEGVATPRFQRSATFIDTGWYNIDSRKTIIELDNSFYRYGENQLEVFLNGERLINNKDYLEGVDLTDPIKGNMSKSFEVIKSIPDNSVLSYKITANVYSYDHIKAYLDTVDKNLIKTIEEVNNTLKEVQLMKANLEESLAQIENNQYYLKTTDLINESQLAPELSDKIYESFIDLRYINENNTIKLLNTTQKDYIEVISDGHYLTKKIDGITYWDYEITFDDVQEVATIQFNPDSSNVNIGSYINIKGFNY